MSLSALAVKRKTAFMMVFTALIGAGVFGYTQLGLSLTPDISFPSISVSCKMVGANPEEMDNLVTEVLEQAVSSVSGVQEINSTSSTGYSRVTVDFDYGDDMDQSETDIRRKVEDFSFMLPEGADDPVVSVMDPSSMPVLTISITSDNLDGASLRRLVEEELDPVINRAEGVGATVISGGSIREIQIEPDPARLAETGISLSGIAAALSGRNNNVPAGELVGNGMRTGLSFELAYQSVSEIGETVVGYNGGSAVLLWHVAEVLDGEEEVTQIVRVNGEEGIILSVLKRSEANTVDVCDAVLEQLEVMDGIYGEQLNITVVSDQSEFIKEAISNLSTTGFIAFLAAITILLLFLRSAKSSYLVGISIPVSLVITFFAMYLFEVDLNMLSLAGLAIAVGMLVDNSIVVIESIYRYREMGESPIQAAIKGAGEVAGAITSSTLTTLMVFIPILFVPGFTGQLFRDMALTISFSLIASLFVAIALVPALSSLFKNITASAKFKKLDSIGSRFSSMYSKALQWSLNNGKKAIVTSIILFIVSIFAMVSIPSELMPVMDQSEIALSYTLARNTDLASNDSIAQIIETEIRGLIPPEYIESFYVELGEKSSARGITSMNQGSINIVLCGSDKRDKSLSEYSFAILSLLKDMPGVEVSIDQKGPFSAGNPVEVILTGDDVRALEATAVEVLNVMENTRGTSSVSSSVQQRIPQYTFMPDQASLTLLGITAAEAAREMQLGFQGRTVASYSEGGDDFNVFLRYPSEQRTEYSDVLYSMNGSVPMDALGNLESTSSVESITRQDQSRTVSIYCGVAPGYTSGEVGARVQDAVNEIDMPQGVRMIMAGDYGDQDDTFLYMLLAVAVAAILVYMVMAGEFESFKEPFIIIFTVPMAFIGVVAALLLTGTEVSIMSLVGLLMLAGIAVNNGIVLVDLANKLKDDGKTAREAITEAARVRTRPIIMTALTTIFAMVPVAMGLGEGSELWQPLGITVIGGLVSATILTLIIEPCLYMYSSKK